MDLNFKSFHKKMGFDNFFSATCQPPFGNRKFSSYPGSMGQFESKLYNMSDGGKIKFMPDIGHGTSTFKPATLPFKEGRKDGSFIKKLPICDHISMSVFIVGGMVGRRRQSGPCHRGREFFRIWDAIRNSFHFQDLKEPEMPLNGKKGTPNYNNNNNTSSNNNNNNDMRSISFMTISERNLCNLGNKSYAEVVKGNPVKNKVKDNMGPAVLVAVPKTTESPCQGNSAMKNEVVEPMNQNKSISIAQSMPSSAKNVSSDSLRSHSSSSESESTISCDSVPGKVRTLSECSIDSDDSFIVFESNEDDVRSSDDSSDEESSEENDEVDFCVPDETKPLVDIAECWTPSCLDAVNSKWDKSYQTSPKSGGQKGAIKKVSFACGKDLVRVQRIVVWDYASRKARVGPWEQLARDSARFRDRIARAERALGPILEPAHRTRIYHQRFTT